MGFENEVVDWAARYFEQGNGVATVAAGIWHRNNRTGLAGYEIIDMESDVGVPSYPGILQKGGHWMP